MDEARKEKLQTFFVATLNGLTVPIMILNLLGGIVSGIWLAFLGEWGAIVRGIIFIATSFTYLVIRGRS